MWCDRGGRHWWVLTWCPKINDEQRMPFIILFCFHMRAVVVVCGRIVSICRRSFSYVGGCRVVVVVVVCCGRSQYFVATSLTATWHLASLSAKKVGGEVCLCTHLLVVVAASDMAPRCHWRGGGVGHSLPLVPFVGGVLSSCCCCGMVVICCGCGCGESSLLSVVAADVAFWHRSDGVPACPGGCWWWAVVWQQWVGVVGGRHEWVLWVGIVGGGG